MPPLELFSCPKNLSGGSYTFAPGNEPTLGATRIVITGRPSVGRWSTKRGSIDVGVWQAGLVAGGLLLAALVIRLFVRARSGSHRPSDLGTVSQRWLTQERVGGKDRLSS